MKSVIWVYIVDFLAGYLSIYLWGAGGLICLILGMLLAHLYHRIAKSEKTLKELKDLEELPPAPKVFE
jgi:hypothetical protein